MATADRILQLKLVADVSDINKGVNKASGKLKGFARSAASWSKAFAFAAVIEGFEAVTDILGDAWDGFREGEKAAAQLGTTWRNLKLDANGLDRALEAIGDSTKALGTDDVEAVNAFNQLLKTTGDSDKAMRRLKIAQDLVANGSAPNLKSAIKIIDGAIKGSGSVVNKYGLTGKTAGERVAQLGRRVRGAAKKAADMNPVGVLFNSINEDLESIVGSFASGDFEAGIAAFATLGDDVGKFFTDVGPAVQGFLDAVTGGAFGDLITKLQELGASIGPDILAAFDSIKGATDAFLGVVNDIITGIQPLIDILSPVVAGSLGAALDIIKGAFEAIKDLLNGDFTGAIDAVKETIGNVAETIGTAMSDSLAALQELLPDITAAALDIGNAILTGIVDTIANIGTTVANLIRDAINGLIDILNGFTFTIPEVAFDIPTFRLGEGTIFDTGPQGGGKFTVFPGGVIDPFDIPKLGDGGIVTRPTLAMIGERGREAVIPLDRMGPTIIINTGVGDPIAIGREVDRVLGLYKRSRGS